MRRSVPVVNSPHCFSAILPQIPLCYKGSPLLLFLSTVNMGNRWFLFSEKNCGLPWASSIFSSLGWTISSAFLCFDFRLKPVLEGGSVFLLCIISLLCFMSFRKRHCISPWQSVKKSQLIRNPSKRKTSSRHYMLQFLLSSLMYRWFSY